MLGELSETKKQAIDDMLKIVFSALKEKGYDPTKQMCEYLFTEDPREITSYNNARKHIAEFKRDEILYFLLEKYLNV